MSAATSAGPPSVGPPSVGSLSVGPRSVGRSSTGPLSVGPVPRAVVVGPDRVREAATARGRELVAARRRLAGGYHADLRAAVAMARLSCSAGLAADLDDLARRAAERAEGSGRAGRAQLPSWLAGELEEVRRRSGERFEVIAGPAVRRVAARLCPGAAPIPLPDVPAGAGPAPTGPAPTGPITGAGVAADPRLLAGLAGLPVLGAGGLGWATALTVAGVLLLLGVLAYLRVDASARARLRAETARAVAAAGVDAERELARRSIEVERAAGAALQRVVTDRCTRAGTELTEVRDALA